MISTRLQLTGLTPAIGAIAGGVDLAHPLPDEEVAAIREALDDRLVLFFPDQRLTPVQQRDFAARFGALYRHPFYPGHADAPEIMILAHDATHRANSDRWHNDVTYLDTPPQAAVLYAEEIPELGGDTLWANMYAAYEALSEPVKQLVVGLRAVHSFAKNFTPERFRALGMEDRRDSLYAEHPPVSHPVARTNPATGRKALFVNQDFTSHIEGVSARESEALLRMLFEHMAQPEFAVRWRWQAGAVAFWDNRWAQHCALADYFPARRRMRRATIVGDKPV
ncbi:MAG: taurine dioxygenase [Candidatus Cybelea sp.]